MNDSPSATSWSDSTSAKYADQVSDFSIMASAGPMMVFFVFVEGLVASIRYKERFRWNDTINSISHGALEQWFAHLAGKTIEFTLFCWIYAHLAPWHFSDTPLLNFVAFLGVDLGYYWFHRMAHEINIFWASHSVHHSSEEYNLSTALRQSAIQSYFSWAFYLPLALIIPPKMFYLHRQINTLYQFWIHSKLIGKLGPIDWVFNTPSNHRVHHGRNPRYLDMNYGGILVIFDHLFGTYHAEDEEAAYGLVHPSKSFNLIKGQLCHFVYIYHRFWEVKGWKNKLSVIFKGPGWTEGSPRLGDPSMVPEVDRNHEKYDPTLPRGFDYYIAINFLASVFFSVFLMMGYLQLSPLHFFFAFYLIFSLHTFSLMSDNNPVGYYLDLVRTASFLIADLICVLIRPSHSYTILWYEADPIHGDFLRAASLGFVVLRFLFLASFLFEMLYISSQHWFAHPDDSKLNVNHLIEDFPSPTPERSESPIPAIILSRYSPIPSPTSKKPHSRKNRLHEAGMAR